VSFSNCLGAPETRTGGAHNGDLLSLPSESTHRSGGGGQQRLQNVSQRQTCQTHPTHVTAVPPRPPRTQDEAARLLEYRTLRIVHCMIRCDVRHESMSHFACVSLFGDNRRVRITSKLDPVNQMQQIEQVRLVVIRDLRIPFIFLTKGGSASCLPKTFLPPLFIQSLTRVGHK